MQGGLRINILSTSLPWHLMKELQRTIYQRSVVLNGNKVYIGLCDTIYYGIIAGSGDTARRKRVRKDSPRCGRSLWEQAL